MTTDIDLPSDNAPMSTNQMLAHWAPVFTKLLAETGVSEQTFTSQIAQAVRSTKGLDQCNPSSILGAGLRCAQLGLTPNDGRNHAWIIPRKGEASFQLGYGGVMELARRAVPGLRFDGRPVYPNDEFELDYGKAEPLTHKPNLADRGGEPFAWYVRALFPDGSTQIQVLDKKGVEHHRKFSQMKDRGMWADSYDAAALKSCVVDLRRWLPQSPQLAAALESDGQVLHVDKLDTIDAGDVGGESDVAAIEAESSES